MKKISIIVKSKLFFIMIVLLSVFFETSTTINPDNHHMINSYFEKFTYGFDLVGRTVENSYISRFVLPSFKDDSSTNFSHQEFKMIIFKKYQKIFDNKKTKILNLNKNKNPGTDKNEISNVKSESKMTRGYDIDEQIYLYMNSLTITNKQKVKYSFNDNQNFTSIGYDNFIDSFEKFYQSQHNFKGYVPKHYLVFDIDDLVVDDVSFGQEIHKIYSNADFYNDRSSILFYHKPGDSMKIFNEITEDFEKYCFNNSVCFYFSIYNCENEYYKKNNIFLKKSSGILKPMYVHYKEINMEVPDNRHFFQKFPNQSDSIIKKISLNINGCNYSLAVMIKELSISLWVQIVPEINITARRDHILEFSLEKQDFVVNCTYLGSRKIFNNITRRVPVCDTFSVKSEDGKIMDLCIDENIYKNFPGISIFLETFLKRIQTEQENLNVLKGNLLIKSF